jgi:hypothetical protein
MEIYVHSYAEHPVRAADVEGERYLAATDVQDAFQNKIAPTIPPPQTFVEEDRFRVVDGLEMFHTGGALEYAARLDIWLQRGEIVSRSRTSN